MSSQSVFYEQLSCGFRLHTWEAEVGQVEIAYWRRLVRGGGRFGRWRRGYVFGGGGNIMHRAIIDTTCDTLLDVYLD